MLTAPSSRVTVEGAFEKVTRGSTRVFSPLNVSKTPVGLPADRDPATVGMGTDVELDGVTEAETETEGEGAGVGVGVEGRAATERTAAGLGLEPLAIFTFVAWWAGEAEVEEEGVMTAAGEKAGPIPTPIARPTDGPAMSEMLVAGSALARFSPISLVTLSTRISATLFGRSFALLGDMGVAESLETEGSLSPGTVK